ncbi:MAG: tRNA (adenosine(37)-N6)-threonylcarbamoyltransferase complex ATPase subunit type 1 TsaE [Candidatus Cardinium sp.]|nr:tRNA (adenosine(37)-N6)-threonylcarbamoyltransferase complex ATPase subunit type 1 TsaE [Candidatus Cardinium sp.]
MILKSSQETLLDTAYKLLDYAGNQKVFLLEGLIGSGKTTLTKALCTALGYTNAQSPTFTLVHEYKTRHGHPIYHFDFYRIHALQDVIALDLEYYLFSGYYCFIEWPSNIKPIWPSCYVLINIEIKTNTSRNLTCHTIAPL